MHVFRNTLGTPLFGFQRASFIRQAPPAYPPRLVVARPQTVRQVRHNVGAFAGSMEANCLRKHFRQFLGP